MEIEYDPEKSRINEAERGLSFEQVAELDWDTAQVEQDTRDYGEARFIAKGLLNGRLHVVCFTMREDVTRIISFRKANKREERAYEKTINR